MFQLIETITGFVAIMLVLSYLVKSLTSVIKAFVDFYTRNLKHEVNRLVMGTLGKTWEELKKAEKVKEKAPWVHDINWKKLGEEYLTKNNMEWVLNKLGDLLGKKVDLENLEGRLAVHLSNIRYAFEKRVKTITLVVGLGLCLVLNINAISIWKTLYTDQHLRSEFASSYTEAALKLAEQGSEMSQAVQPGKKVAGETREGGSKEGDIGQEKKELEERTEAILEQLERFRTDVSFGVGRIWEGPPEPDTPEEEKDWLGFLLYELLGSLLTGILVGIGAPYWHDLLRALAGIRRRPKKTARTAVIAEEAK